MKDDFSNYTPLKKGLTIFDKKHKDEILVNPLFIKAKNGNAKAAEELITSLWTDEKTTELKNLLDKNKEPVFISMPGTSRKNQLPIVYAKFLSTLTQKMGGRYIVGDEHILSLHTSMMKSINNEDRLFSPRLYEASSPDFFTSLKEQCPNAQFILVEDILTTGASANTFRRFMEKNGIQLDQIFALKGNTELSPSTSEILKLQKMGKKCGLYQEGKNLDFIALGKELTSSEINTLSFHFLGQKYQFANKKIKQLMRFLLFCLYDIKVNNNLDAIWRLERISELIKRKEKQHEKEHLTTNIGFLNAFKKQNGKKEVGKECPRDTKRESSSNQSERNAPNSTPSSERRIWDNSNRRKPTQNRTDSKEETKTPSNQNKGLDTSAIKTFKKLDRNR